MTRSVNHCELFSFKYIIIFCRCGSETNFPESQLTSQDLVTDVVKSDEKNADGSTVSLDQSADIIFISEFQTVKDVPGEEKEAEMQADLMNVTLQLSPSQMTQPQQLDESEDDGRISNLISIALAIDF